jgi:hypothetical protein
MNVIEYIAKTNMLKNIIATVGKNEQKHNLQDLEQDIYICLLGNKTNEELEEMYNKKELNFYLTRIVMNNINSKTSRYYYTYKKTNNDSNVTVEDLVKKEYEEKD